MAIRLEDEYAGRVNPANASYPDGSIKNETVPNSSNDGTPLDEFWGNDIEGFKQSSLFAAGIVPSGIPDAVGACQIFLGLNAVSPNVVTMKAAGLTLGQSVLTKEYAAGTNSGAAIYKLVTKAEHDAIRGYTTVDEAGDHTDTNGNVLLLQMNNFVDITQFGAVDDLTVDSSISIQAAANAVKASATRVRSGLTLTHPIFDKQKSLYIPDGMFMHSVSLWFGVDVDAEDLEATPDYSKVVNKITGTGMLFATCTGKVAWDFTGVFGLHIDGPITFWGDHDNQPRVGMLFARSGTGGLPHNPSAGNHFGTGFRLLGSYSLCSMYNYGSEINHWTNVDLLNFSEAGTAVVINTANNARYVVISEYATVDTTIQSAYADSFINCTANLVRTAVVTGDEGVFVLESVAYGPKCVGGYMDASSSVYTPYFRFVDALGVVGTAAITQSPTLQGVTFESEAVPIVEIEGTVTNLNIAGCSLSTSGGQDHIVIQSGGVLTQYDVQAYSGDTLNLPVTYDIQAGGSATRGQLDTVPVDDAFLTNYQLNIGDLIQDGTYRDIDISTIAGVPPGAKYVHVKTRVRSAAASDGTSLILRGDATTSVPESFISLPNGTASSQYTEGRVPVVDDKIQYAASVGLTVASLIIKAYEV